ncbi:hypothetical protein STEG23_015157 [Scotinomys teguina]
MVESGVSNQTQRKQDDKAELRKVMTMSALKKMSKVGINTRKCESKRLKYFVLICKCLMAYVHCVFGDEFAKNRAHECQNHSHSQTSLNMKTQYLAKRDPPLPTYSSSICVLFIIIINIIINIIFTIIVKRLSHSRCPNSMMNYVLFLEKRKTEQD